MSQTIQDYLKLATGTSGTTLVALIKRALLERGIFVYGELLSLENVQILSKGGEEEKRQFEQLQLFAYGDYPDFKSGGETKYGKLNPAQIKKLKMLTIASLGAKSSQLTYDRLSKALDINNVRELEDLILDTIYEGLLFAKLDQAGKIVQVDYSIGRDVKKEQLEGMQKVLSIWLARSEELDKKIEEKVKYSQGEWKMNITRKEEFDKLLTEKKEQLQMLLATELEEGGGGRRGGRKGQGGRMGLGLGMLQGLMRGLRN